MKWAPIGEASPPAPRKLLLKTHRGLLDELDHRFRLRHIDGVTAPGLGDRSFGALRHHALRGGRDHPIVRGHQVPAGLALPGGLADVVATARPGSPVEVGDVALDGESFVSIFRDLTTYCVKSWDTKDYRRICLAERQVGRFPGDVTGIFQRARKHHAQRLALGKHHELVHIADPAVRRVAIWLVLQVIVCPTPPARLNAMRLGRSPHVDFLGPWDHEGLNWLAERAQRWPAHYRARCWDQFLPPSLIYKGSKSH
jgi:hypothetical protein